LLHKLIIKHNTDLLDIDMLNEYTKFDDADFPKISKDAMKNCAINEMEKNLFDIDQKTIEYFISERFSNEKKKYLTSIFIKILFYQF
jgi:hypothetical protein